MENVEICDRVVDAFREQEVTNKFGFFFVSSIEPGEMIMNWAYGNGANWTASTGIALLERVIYVAQQALEQAQREQQ